MFDENVNFGLKTRTENGNTLVQCGDRCHVFVREGEFPDVQVLHHLVFLERERHGGDTTLIGPAQTYLERKDFR